MINSSKRLFYIDNLKTFLILTVIFGHCIQQYDVDFDNNPLFRFIYSFHMPLFFFVSGFLSHKDKLHIGNVSKRFVQLVIPFIAWGLYLWLRFGRISLIDILLTPDTGLWFLWVLFLIYTLVGAINVISRHFIIKEEYISLAIIPALYVTGAMVNAFGLSLVAWYFPFFIGGYFLKKHLDVCQSVPKLFLWVILATFIFFASFWHRTQCPSFIGFDNKLTLMAYKLLTASLGIISIFGLFRSYINHKYLMFSDIGGGQLRSLRHSSLPDFRTHITYRFR